MLMVTIGKLVDEDIPYDEYEDCCIYVVYDGDVVFYVGQSNDPVGRLWQHMGAELGWLSYASRSSDLGRFIGANLPKSRRWQVDLLTLEDCKTYTVFNIPAISKDGAEAELINLLEPCLNKYLNRNLRSDKLAKYKKPWIRKITAEMISFLD